MGQLVEPYVLKEGLKVIDEHALYIPKNPYVLVNSYMINAILFDEHLKVSYKEVLENQAAKA